MPFRPSSQCSTGVSRRSWVRPPTSSRPTCLRRRLILSALTLLGPLVLAGCLAEEEGPGEAANEGNAGPREEAVSDSDPISVDIAHLPPDQAFLANLAAHCGAAFSGGLTLEPPGDDMLTGTEELVVHFRECQKDTLRIPFHIEVEETGEWDRSRTWILSQAEEGRLELRHDHREPDGSPSERTLYGGFTETAGTPNRQDFVSVERTEESGYPRGWRIEIIPGERYTYGTTRRGEWSWRVDFDLTQEIPSPPAPWGHR